MLDRLFSNLSHGLVAATAVAALVLSVVAIAKLQEARSMEVRNAASGDCSQTINQHQSGRDNRQSAAQRCNSGGTSGGGSRGQVVARARGNAPVTARSGSRNRAARKARAKGGSGADVYGGCGAGGCDDGLGPGGGPLGKPYPLKGNAWTQGARESDQFVGEVTYTGCRRERDAVFLEFAVNGTMIGEALVPGARRAGPRTESFQVERFFAGGSVLFERGQNRRRRLTARVASACGDPVTVKSLKVNVLGFR